MTPEKADQRGVLFLDNELGMGGSEKLLYEFIARVDRARFSVAVCCLKNGGYWKDRVIEQGVPFYERILRHRFDVTALRRLARIVKERDVELIDTYAHPNTVILSWLARKLGLVKGFVVNFHATGNLEGGRLVPAYLKPLLGKADALVALAESHRRYLTEVEGLDEGRFEVIHNGVDTERFRPSLGDEREAARARLGVDPEEVVLTAVASLKPAKRIDLLLEAAAGVARGVRGVRLMIVGDGPDRRRLEALAGQLEIADRVTFAGFREDVREILRGSDGLVLTSRTEAFPMVVLEAMATGLPVVTTDVGSVRDMVEKDRSAFIVPPEDRDALSAAIAALVDDPSAARAMGERGRQIVLERFDVDNMCEIRQNLFEKIIVSL